MAALASLAVARMSLVGAAGVSKMLVGMKEGHEEQSACTLPNLSLRAQKEASSVANLGGKDHCFHSSNAGPDTIHRQSHHPFRSTRHGLLSLGSIHQSSALRSHLDLEGQHKPPHLQTMKRSSQMIRIVLCDNNQSQTTQQQNSHLRTTIKICPGSGRPLGAIDGRDAISPQCWLLTVRLTPAVLTTKTFEVRNRYCKGSDGSGGQWNNNISRDSPCFGGIDLSSAVVFEIRKATIVDA